MARLANISFCSWVEISSIWSVVGSKDQGDIFCSTTIKLQPKKSQFGRRKSSDTYLLCWNIGLQEKARPLIFLVKTENLIGLEENVSNYLPEEFYNNKQGRNANSDAKIMSMNMIIEDKDDPIRLNCLN